MNVNQSKFKFHTSKYQPADGVRGKATKVTINVSTNFYGNPFYICWDISVWRSWIYIHTATYIQTVHAHCIIYIIFIKPFSDPSCLEWKNQHLLFSPIYEEFSFNLSPECISHEWKLGFQSYDFQVSFIHTEVVEAIHYSITIQSVPEDVPVLYDPKKTKVA